ncbi:MAG: hypothetical protein ACYSUQ_16045 [Planctomycetota bacterium]|jgi:Tfp pilus assembly protein PilO
MKVSSLLAIDLLGAALAVACAGAGLWYGLFKPGSASAQIRDLTAEVEELEATVVKMRAALDGQQAVYRQREAVLEERDLLPGKTPVERDLHTISDLAQQNRLEINDLTPMEKKQYPGVVEVRYRLRTNGRFTDYLGFLRGFEASSSWADIVHLELVSADAQTNGDTSGEATVSIYAAIEEDAAAGATP